MRLRFWKKAVFVRPNAQNALAPLRRRFDYFCSQCMPASRNKERSVKCIRSIPRRLSVQKACGSTIAWRRDAVHSRAACCAGPCQSGVHLGIRAALASDHDPVWSQCSDHPYRNRGYLTVFICVPLHCSYTETHHGWDDVKVGMRELGSDHIFFAPIDNRRFVSGKYIAWARHSFRGTSLDWIVFTAKSAQIEPESLVLHLSHGSRNIPVIRRKSQWRTRINDGRNIQVITGAL